jgi:uncharacterized protein YozE (UPF0346 family)
MEKSLDHPRNNKSLQEMAWQIYNDLMTPKKEERTLKVSYLKFHT